MTGTVINIGKDFSRYPAGRFPSDGKFNGETFRKKYLLDPINSNNNIKIYLDDAVDFGSSFLEEAFGGLVRTEKIPQDKIKRLISFETKNHPFVPDEIWTYISDEAGKESA